MQSPLKGNKHGWTETITQYVPRTVERKRKGRGVDRVSLPTPPSQVTHFPTPETIRRSSRPRKPTEHSSSSTTIQLPTPQTQRTKRRLSPSIHSSSRTEEEPIPSPSGHTTFYLSSNNASTSSSSSRPDKIRRRPGLTFAQQMGLLSTSKSTSVGVGRGIGGYKNGIHGKVDQIGLDKGIQLKADIYNQDGNPFLVGLGPSIPLASPGQITIHQPGEDENDSDIDESKMLCPSPRNQPRRSPRLASPSPGTQFQKPTISIISPTGLLSPPPTKHAPRIGIIPLSTSTSTSTSTQKMQGLTRQEMAKRRKEEEERIKMLDYNDNPFLIKNGESSTRIPKTRGPIVNEDLPTVTYVFRGSKKVFANPLYPSNAPFPRSELYPEDDEFEPHPLPKPKLLWPKGPSPKNRNSMRTPSPFNGREDEISPPSSPVSTPTTSTRFGKSIRTTNSGNKLEGHMEEEDGIYSDDEGELMMRDIRRDHGVAEEEHVEEELPSRRGLLFGAGNMSANKGVKRSLGGGVSGVEDTEGRGKKARGMMRL